MSRRKKGKKRTCISCQTEKPAVEFHLKSRVCMACDENKDVQRHPHYRMQSNLDKLHEEIRYKNAHVVKGYKFKGKVVEPRDPRSFLYAD